MDPWIAERLPIAAKLQPGAWHTMHDFDDGRSYRRETIAGTYTVVLFGRIDDKGRHWMNMMAGFQRDKKPATAPSWNEIREIKGIFFGDEEANAIIPVLPRDEMLRYAPTVIHLWLCIDENIMPSWPGQEILPPGWTHEDADRIRTVLDEEAAKVDPSAHAVDQP